MRLYRWFKCTRKRFCYLRRDSVCMLPLITKIVPMIIKSAPVGRNTTVHLTAV